MKGNKHSIKTNLVKLAKVETVSAVKLLGVNTDQLLVRTLTSPFRTHSNIEDGGFWESS